MRTPSIRKHTTDCCAGRADVCFFACLLCILLHLSPITPDVARQGDLQIRRVSWGSCVRGGARSIPAGLEPNLHCLADRMAVSVGCRTGSPLQSASFRSRFTSIFKYDIVADRSASTDGAVGDYLESSTSYLKMREQGEAV
jgi:hypothetical protein